MFTLCGEIAAEKDPRKFSQLLQELNDLLQRKEYRLKGGNPDKASSSKPGANKQKLAGR